MKTTGTFTYLGIDRFKVKEQEYQSLCLLQETDLTKVFLQATDLPKLTDLKPMDNVDVELDIKIGTKTYVSLLSIKKTIIKAA